MTQIEKFWSDVRTPPKNREFNENFSICGTHVFPIFGKTQVVVLWTVFANFVPNFLPLS